MSDFSGALTIWKDFDAKLSGHFDRILFMQESGVLKRLAGDLQGPLDDMTPSLKILSGVDDNCSESCCPQRYMYICHMQRSYVNFLLKDVGGVLDDWANEFKLLGKLLGDKRSKVLGLFTKFWRRINNFYVFQSTWKERNRRPRRTHVASIFSSDGEGDYARLPRLPGSFSNLVCYDRAFFLRERGVLK